MTTKVLPFITVRNPRNLEWLRIARKAYGYKGLKNFQNECYYYRQVIFFQFLKLTTVELEKGQNHTNAYVRHMTNGIVLEASTKEYAIRRRLHSTTDVASALNLGRILAFRCLKAGIHFVNLVLPDSQAFRTGLEEVGLVLKEFETIEPDYSVDKRYHWVCHNPDYGKDFSAT
ncbi:dynactin subunit 5 [Trichuris trichiura]|uniref:Dynactin subunit 5 n=1 Tax=Trichuris trichiura TaxID=36087 RepID=A0A077Z5K4_TRITR|nr:dynactin subunit 5 [Trichuris trichiura]